MSTKPFHSLEDHETLRQLIRNLREGIYITNSRGEILDANPACLEIFGIASLAELRTWRAQDLFWEPADRAREVEALARDGEIREFELRLRRPDGEERTVLDSSYAVNDPETGDVLYHGILVDITSRKQLEERLHELSVRDPLTGCYNRRYLSDLERSLGAMDASWGAIMVDVDNFKGYNDNFGHQVGDGVLVRVSRFLFQNARAMDAVVRMGGDEFLLLLLGEHAASAARVARRLMAAASGADLVPFSVGWATRRGEESLEATIDRADKKLMRVRVEERRLVGERRQRRAT